MEEKLSVQVSTRVGETIASTLKQEAFRRRMKLSNLCRIVLEDKAHQLNEHRGKTEIPEVAQI